MELAPSKTSNGTDPDIRLHDESGIASTTECCAGDGEGPLLTDVFREFSPLLVASQNYARLSGCRFRMESFRGILEERTSGGALGDEEAAVGAARQGSDREHAAKLRAAPAVRMFSERLQAEDPALIEELECASRIVNAEGVRSAMVAAFQLLELWPPTPAPLGIDEEDCCFEDVSAPMQVIAQRAYNDEARRAVDASVHGGVSKMQHRARTAAYLVDFASEFGVPLPAMRETQVNMLREFLERVADYEASQADSLGQPLRESVQNAILHALGAGAVIDKLPSEAETRQWLANHRTAAIWTATAAGLLTVGPIPVAGIHLARWAWNKKSSSGGDSIEEEPNVASALNAESEPTASQAVLHETQ